MNTSSRLLEFMHERKLVRFSRRFEGGWVHGYVLDVGPKFALLATLGEVRFDGFGCFAIADMKGLRLDPYAAFSEAARKKLRDRKPRRPKVSVASVEELLLSANQAFPLITIHRERIKPESCWIGKVEKVERGKVTLMEIGPDAQWDEESTSYKLSEITCVEFGGEYENALHFVGGEPSAKSKTRSTTPR